jgi:hypothetical protein
VDLALNQGGLSLQPSSPAVDQGIALDNTYAGSTNLVSRLAGLAGIPAPMNSNRII